MDLHEYSRYLEFRKDNFKPYSVNLVHLYLLICSEIDVLLKFEPQTYEHAQRANFRPIQTIDAVG